MKKQSCLNGGIALVAICFCIASFCDHAMSKEQTEDEVARDVDFKSIATLAEIQGGWAIAPEGVGLFEGDYLEIKGARCKYGQFTCARPAALKKPIEFDIALENGVLVLRSDNPHPPAKKWRLAEIDKHRMLVCVTVRDSAPFVTTSRILYHQPNFGKTPAAGIEQKQAPEVGKPFKRSPLLW